MPWKRFLVVVHPVLSTSGAYQYNCQARLLHWNDILLSWKRNPQDPVPNTEQINCV